MPDDILVIMTDQHRADWIGAFGAKHVRTPNFDRLASEGAIFTRCTTASPICMPARVSFLTGMYPHNFGMWHNVGRLQDTRDTCLHPLKQAGYRTCHIGKSHLYPHGSGKDLRDEEPYMHALGWDDIRETTGPLSTRTTFSILTDWMKEHDLYQTFLDDYVKRHEVGINKATWPSPLPDGMHSDDFVCRTAEEYIAGSDRDTPLYLFVGFGGPHDPWDPPASYDTYRPDDMPLPIPADPAPEWLTGPAREYHERMMSHHADITPEGWQRVRSLYSARVEHLDHLVGRVLDAWRTARGDNGWTIHWSDHGEMAGDKSRSSKAVFYESSVHVPATIRPPGGSSKSVKCSGLIGLTDLSATVLDIAGCEPGPNVFGTSVLPAFDSPDSVGAPVVFSEIGDLTMAFDGRWKMLVNSRDDVLQLFDLQSDPTESLNLAGHPDTSDVVQRLRNELLDFLLRTTYRQHREVNG